MNAQAPGVAVPGWRGLIGGFGLLAVAEIVARLLGLASVVTMAHVLGPDGLGIIVLGMTLVAYAAIGVDAGTELLAVRDLGRSPERLRSIVEPVLGLRLAIALMLGSLLVVVALVVGAGSNNAETVALFALALPALALNPRFMAVAVRASGGVAIGNITGQLVLLLGVLALVGSGDTTTVALLVAGGEFAYALVVLGVLARRHGMLRPHVDIASWRGTLQLSGPLLGYGIARAAIYSADVLLIGVLLGAAEAGQYGAAYKPVLLVSGGMGLFYVSLLAALGDGAEGGRHLARKALRIIPPFVLAGAVTMSASAPLTIPLAFGEEFTPAVPVLAVLAFTLPIQAAGGAYFCLLVAAGRQRTLLRINAAGAAANVLANLAVIPLLGIVGAAGVTVTTELLVQLSARRAAIRGGLADFALVRSAPRT